MLRHMKLVTLVKHVKILNLKTRGNVYREFESCIDRLVSLPLECSQI